jgi:hypothetical protein
MKLWAWLLGVLMSWAVVTLHSSSVGSSGWHVGSINLNVKTWRICCDERLHTRVPRHGVEAGDTPCVRGSLHGRWRTPCRFLPGRHRDSSPGNANPNICCSSTKISTSGICRQPFQPSVGSKNPLQRLVLSCRSPWTLARSTRAPVVGSFFVTAPADFRAPWRSCRGARSGADKCGMAYLPRSPLAGMLRWVAPV